MCHVIVVKFVSMKYTISHSSTKQINVVLSLFFTQRHQYNLCPAEAIFFSSLFEYCNLSLISIHLANPRGSQVLLIHTYVTKNKPLTNQKFVCPTAINVADFPDVVPCRARIDVAPRNRKTEELPGYRIWYSSMLFCRSSRSRCFSGVQSAVIYLPSVMGRIAHNGASATYRLC